MFYLGIALQKELFRVAVIKKKKKQLSIESVHFFPYGPDHVKLFYNLAPFQKGKEVVLASGLGSQDLFIRKLHLPLGSKAKILKALPFQLESLLPFSDVGALICTQLKTLGPQMTSVTMIATTEAKLQEHLERLAPLKIKLDRVSCNPAALLRFSSHCFPEESKILCLDAREGQLTCALVEQGEILLSQQLSLETDPLAVEKLSLFLKQKGAIDDQTPWILTGEAGLREKAKGIFLGKELATQGPEHDLFALAIGLGLDAAIDDESSIQFCQKHLTAAHTLKKRKKHLFLYTACCLGAALVMAISNSLFLRKKERLLGEKLKTCFSAASEGGIKENLIRWEETLKGKNNTFALVPNVPKVSDLLAYLSAHPCLVTEEGEQKEGVEIKSIHYNLAKYPKIGETTAPYAAQVELEFSSPTPRVARDFHETLLKGDVFVNSKKEIKWQALDQTYQASFELNKGILQ